MPEQGTDSHPAAQRASGAHDGSGHAPSADGDTQADSRLATARDSGAGPDSRMLPITEVDSRNDSEGPTEPDASLASRTRGVPGSELDVDADPLLELLAQWEERYCRDPATSCESLGINDPGLLDALRERIDQQKRLYTFLGLSPAALRSDAATQGDQACPGERGSLPVREQTDRASAQMLSGTDPAFIGRYRVRRLLGQGGFGRVYLAHDPVLDRDVAIKVPSQFRGASLLDVEAYLEEARILARLEHPNIVPVYDVGHGDDGLCYVVSKYMEGGDLAAQLGRGRPAFADSGGLVAALSDALHYTHTQDLFHRDIKPANILLDAAGVPYLADFGLALKDENLGKGARHVGTAGYMSPEQARGEGHRVDGRSDIFSMGVVLFELLTGRRPFRGGSHWEVIQQIISAEPRPPRQIDDTIPRELERICLKALSKRASERYSTARDLAEDLRHFLTTAAPAVAKPDALPAIGPATTAPISVLLNSMGRAIRIVPKGLGSFDENDADFFLELLPGPRDRDGLPDGLRLWKTRIETTDPDRTFRVGLIYGPSGCGKSSLVKAGLIPLLGRHVAALYVESTALETEARLLRGIRKRVPELPADVGLVGLLTLLRQGHGLEPGQKVLLVLDQFEQWLFASKGETAMELVAALRQCDGERVQALCLVRDDFWMAATRFMKDLEIDLVPDRNVAAVDLFDLKHTRRVLEACGRAYEALPSVGDLAKDQKNFLDQAVDGLAEDGRVVPVRLALFAEMVKGKPWSPATLRDLGGMDGVGVKFLEDTFSSTRSNPRHHFHQKAAQAVLKSLLPGTTADIKGRMRSIEELRDISGYTDRPADFVDLVRILDSDLRLITPVDPEGVADDEWRVAGENSDECAALPTVGSVAVRHGTGGEVLSGDQGSPKGGAVRTDKSNPTVGGVDPGKHRRGTGEGAHQGIPQPPEHRPRILDGSGNAPDVEPAGGVAATRGTRELVGADRPHQPDAQRPTQSAGKTAGNLTTSYPATLHSPPCTRHYQLTHDYLVHSLRDWLTRKQKETRRGRAGLRLATITSFWRDRPEPRRLPSLLEWLDIVCYTQSRFWSDSERRMMRDATRHYAVRGLAAAVVLVVLSIAIMEYRGRVRAESLVSKLLIADTSQVAAILKETDLDLGRTRLELGRFAGDPARSPKERLHASLALLPFDGARDDYVFERLLGSEPDQLSVISTRLETRRAAFIDRLWAVASGIGTDRKRQLRAACALARLDPADGRWAELARDVAGSLVLDENAFHLEQWLDALRPVRKALLKPAAAIFRDRARSDDERFKATVVLEQFADDDADFLVKLIKDADLRQYTSLLPLLKRHGAKVVDLLAGELESEPAGGASEDAKNEVASQQANCAVTLLLLGQPRKVWSLLAHSPEPRVRGYLIDRIEPMGVDPRMLIDRLRDENDASVRRALILALADYRGKGLTAAERAKLEIEQLDTFRDDPDPGVHAAAELLLRRYGHGEQVDAIAKRLKGTNYGAASGWYVIREGYTMIVIDSRGKDKALSCRRRLDRVFALASKEVSVTQFLKFRSIVYEPESSPTANCPINCVTWYDAAAYCRWLSEREGLKEEEMCYPPIPEIKEGMRLPRDYLRRIGYRLPTEAEAEYACRAGAVTSRFFGSADILLPKYAYFRGNSDNHSWPVGSLKPNDLGLFDILGNVLEWCQESRAPTDRAEDKEDTDKVSNTIERVVHSASYDKVIARVRSDQSEHALPAAEFNSIGFRLARTQRP